LSLEAYSDLEEFIRIVSDAGCRKFTTHARIAVLEGLSPKENRDVPPLRPEEVYQLKRDFPNLFIEINGGYRNADSIDEALKHVDAVMLGRIALDNPWMLAEVDQRWFGSPDIGLTRRKVLDAVVPYMIRRSEEGASRGLLIQPLMNLFSGRKGAKLWKRSMTEIHSAGSEGFGVALEAAISRLDDAVLDEDAGSITT
jgi:tRNA-dihydrouridine synthase A